jgi:hypothetical protein
MVPSVLTDASLFTLIRAAWRPLAFVPQKPHRSVVDARSILSVQLCYASTDLTWQT